MRRFLEDRRGNVAMVFSLSLVPLVGFAGVAVDYSRASAFRSYAQKSIDTATLNAAVVDGTAAKINIIESTKNTMKAAAQPAIQNVAVAESWENPTDYRLDASAEVPTSVLRAVPGMPSAIKVSVAAVARVYQPVMMSGKPKMSQLDPEAGDYNQIYIYCYNKDKKNESNKGRTQMTLIADNGGSTYSYEMPVCGDNETISYRLRNVRGMRTTPSKWNSTTAEQYNYYTDTTLTTTSDGKFVQQFNTGVTILETVICETLNKCKSGSGGVLPSGKNRTPQTATTACPVGQFMYFGWEDRPPNVGAWTDEDYDDIRVIIECPKIEKGQKNVRLIK